MASGLENIETVESPFRRFVTTIGVFPTAFTDAMTYYECLAYLVKYMEETLIPAINENAEAVEELQGLYIQLKAYVDNYFDNLDVQEEINNKLDQMVEDGTLQEIITSYIQQNVTWTFDSIADMKSATNLVEGSYAQTVGYHSRGDGGGAYFLIRENTGSETEGNGKFIINSTLIAEMLYTGEVNIRQFGADGDTTTDESSIVQSAIDYVFSKGGGKVIFNAPILINQTIYINPTADLLPLELTGITDTVNVGGTGMYSSPNNIIRTTAGDIFSVNRDSNGLPFVERQWSKFAVRNLQFYVRNESVNVTAIHCIRDNNTLFENLYFYNTYESIKYEYSYTKDGNTVVCYNDFTKLVNCHTSQCKFTAYNLTTGENKSMIDCSCNWCDAGIKYGANLVNCRNMLIKNFMFSNDEQQQASDSAVIRESGSYLIIDDIYVEYSGMPVIRAEGGYVSVNSLYLKFDYPSIIHCTGDAVVDIDMLHVASGTLTGTTAVTGNSGYVKAKNSNVALNGGNYTQIKIEDNNTYLCHLYRLTGTTVGFANIGNNTGYIGLFQKNGSDAYTFSVSSGDITIGNFKFGTLRGIEIVSEASNDVTTRVKELAGTDGLKLHLTNADGTDATTIPSGYDCLVRFYYR